MRRTQRRSALAPRTRTIKSPIVRHPRERPDAFHFAHYALLSRLAFLFRLAGSQDVAEFGEFAMMTDDLGVLGAIAALAQVGASHEHPIAAEAKLLCRPCRPTFRNSTC